MSSLELLAIGDEVGLILPSETVARLKLRVGDTLYAVDTPDGVRLTTRDLELERQIELGRDIMKRKRAVLSELAKR